MDNFDLAYVIKNGGIPRMFMQRQEHGFFMVPYSSIVKKFHNPDYSPWPYAFVNRENGMYKLLFNSLDDLAEALFSAKEICCGSYPEDAKPNPLYGKSIEWIKMQRELTDS